MGAYLTRRCLYMLLIMVVLSITAFFLIQLPPGDFLSAYVAGAKASGESVSNEVVEALRHRYGLDQPFIVQYLKWVGGIMRGDMGISFTYGEPVANLVVERLPATILISALAMLFAYGVAIPIGIYSATHQYSFQDYALTVVGFVGLAVPSFLLCLIVMYFAFRYLGLTVGGLVSIQYLGKPMSWGKLIDGLGHLWIPVVVVAASGTASLIRVMRGCLLDELHKQYVDTARVKGVEERTLIYRYPVRVAINPIVSSVAWMLPEIVSGQTIVAIVLNLPTIGALLYRALINQDMYLAGSIVMVLSGLTVLGTLVSDVLLGVVDPRIRLERSSHD